MNASLRRDAAAMRAAAVQQRLDDEQQRVRLRALKDESEALQDRVNRRR